MIERPESPVYFLNPDSPEVYSVMDLCDQPFGLPSLDPQPFCSRDSRLSRRLARSTSAQTWVHVCFLGCEARVGFNVYELTVI